MLLGKFVVGRISPTAVRAWPKLLRVLIVVRPLHRQIRLSWLSQEAGPPLCSGALLAAGQINQQER